MKNSEVIQHLLRQISDGDEHAFEKFFHIYFSRVFKFTRYFIADETICKEIVSDVFFNLWQSRNVLSNIQDIEGYLFIASKNRAIKNKNKLKKYPTVTLEDLPVEFFIETETPEKKLENAELREYIEKAINRLPDRCKIIFMMFREQGLKYKEIAEILSITEPTVHAQIQIATRKITEYLQLYLNR